jgi:hypothetical protein
LNGLALSFLPRSVAARGEHRTITSPATPQIQIRSGLYQTALNDAIIANISIRKRHRKGESVVICQGLSPFPFVR